MPSPRAYQTQEALEKKLFEIVKLPMVNAGRVALTIDRARQQLIGGGRLEEVINKSLDVQLQDSVQEFSPEIQEALKKQWQQSDWVIYSTRAEHTLNSRPLGEVLAYGRDNMRLYLDSRLQNLPILSKLIQMVVLTNAIGPRLEVLGGEGLAFYQQTHEAQETLTLASGFWALAQWLQLVQVEKVLMAEIKASGLQLQQIREMMTYIKDLHQGESSKLLNQYVKWHHPQALLKPQLKEFFQAWLREAVNRSPLPIRPSTAPTTPVVREAKILEFKPRPKKVDASTCATVLSE